MSVAVKCDERIQLSAGVTWCRSGSDIIIYSDEILALREVTPEVAGMIEALETGITREQAETVGGADAPETLDLLERLNYVVAEPTRKWKGTRLERQVDWFSAMGFDAGTAQERLCNANLAVLGLGGIGSVVLQHLVGAGVARFTLIDSDEVEASNLNRQPLYSPDEIGAPKVDAAAAYIERHAPGSRVTTHYFRVTSAGEIHALMECASEDWDCLVVAADQPTDLLSKVISPFCMRTGVPAIGGACGLRTARWGPLITKLGLPQGECAPIADLPPALGVMSASFGPTNAIVSDCLAQDVITLLIGGVPKCAGKIIMIDFARLGMRSTLL